VTINEIADGVREAGRTNQVISALIDKWIDDRIEFAMPKIVAALRGSVTATKWDGRPCVNCGHVASRHSASGLVCCVDYCECKAFAATEQRESSAT